MSGVTEKKEEEGEQMEMTDEEEKPSKKRRKVVADEGRMMGFGPYHRNAYGEVLGNNPRYARYLIEEGMGDNRQSLFAHWVMSFVAETFFWEDREGMGNSTEGGSQKRWTGEMQQLERIRSSGISKVRENREKKWLANRE